MANDEQAGLGAFTDVEVEPADVEERGDPEELAAFVRSREAEITGMVPGPESCRAMLDLVLEVAREIEERPPDPTDPEIEEVQVALRGLINDYRQQTRTLRCHSIADERDALLSELQKMRRSTGATPPDVRSVARSMIVEWDDRDPGHRYTFEEIEQQMLRVSVKGMEGESDGAVCTKSMHAMRKLIPLVRDAMNAVPEESAQQQLGGGRALEAVLFRLRRHFRLAVEAHERRECVDSRLPFEADEVYERIRGYYDMAIDAAIEGDVDGVTDATGWARRHWSLLGLSPVVRNDWRDRKVEDALDAPDPEPVDRGFDQFSGGA